MINNITLRLQLVNNQNDIKVEISDEHRKTKDKPEFNDNKVINMTAL